MSKTPKTIFAWPNEDGRGWYAGSCSDEITMCFADVQYTRTDLTPKWSPIETAPKDGTEILGFWEYVYPGDRSRTCGQRVISWEADWNGWLDDEGETHTFGALEDKGLFTHWQPLPAPPKEEK